MSPEQRAERAPVLLRELAGPLRILQHGLKELGIDESTGHTPLRLREEDTALPTLASTVSGLGEHFGRPRMSLYGSPFERRRDVLAFADQAITAAHELYASRQARPGTSTPLPDGGSYVLAAAGRA